MGGQRHVDVHVFFSCKEGGVFLDQNFSLDVIKSGNFGSIYTNNINILV